jgi:hypothetical protein
MEVPSSTLTGLTRGNSRASMWGRRAFLALMLLFVVTGLTGFLGVHSGDRSASAGGYRLSLHYAQVARAGLDVPWQLTVTHPGGFSGPVTLAVTGGYFDIFESQGIDPEPSKETSTDQTLYLTFDPPPGDTLQVSEDIYVQPSSQQGRSGTVSVLERGSPVASVSFRTRLLP